MLHFQQVFLSIFHPHEHNRPLPCQLHRQLGGCGQELTLSQATQMQLFHQIGPLKFTSKLQITQAERFLLCSHPTNFGIIIYSGNALVSVRTAVCSSLHSEAVLYPVFHCPLDLSLATLSLASPMLLGLSVFPITPPRQLSPFRQWHPNVSITDLFLYCFECQ